MNKINKHDFKYIKPGKVSVLVDGQFGSTGKGLLAAYLASQPQNEVQVATTNASANAGHTTRFKDKSKKGFVCFHLPTFGIIQDKSVIYINAGAIIDPEILLGEIEEHNCGKRIFIHPRAVVIQPEHKDAERDHSSSTTKLGGTQKGCGQALADKVLRKAKLAWQHPVLSKFCTVFDLNDRLSKGQKVSMEIPQGYSLSVNGPFYPKCTSRNCTVMAGMNDANVHPDFLGPVSMSLRTYPIRVGNIKDENGEIIGHSGPGYGDQYEITWNDLGVTPEITTVTKRVRRVFTWSDTQFRDATRDNRPDILFLNFVNYFKLPDQFDSLVSKIVKDYRKIVGTTPDILYGMGPNVEDVYSDRDTVDDMLKAKE